jgi:hypothetical protein
MQKYNITKYYVTNVKYGNLWPLILYTLIQIKSALLKGRRLKKKEKLNIQEKA